MQPLALTAVLAVLPTYIHQLDLRCDCSRLVLRMLRRFPRLDSVQLGSSAAFADWRGAGPMAANLQGQLTIDCRRAGGTGSLLDDELASLPTGLPEAPPHSAGLHCLVLDSCFDYEAAVLCSAPPALHTLK